jgi:hypothetical protein
MSIKMRDLLKENVIDPILKGIESGKSAWYKTEKGSFRLGKSGPYFIIQQPGNEYSKMKYYNTFDEFLKGLENLKKKHSGSLSDK